MPQSISLSSSKQARPKSMIYPPPLAPCRSMKSICPIRNSGKQIQRENPVKKPISLFPRAALVIGSWGVFVIKRLYI
ncbi:hypothetical protein VTL71DRAFT_600 [Oculimacula yallundae]|uniref:Uncharacterized protein n=1 Tax=Oculimacula yallundae TaxID=86028 RepID=A0ABR4D0J8_9HELO